MRKKFTMLLASLFLCMGAWATDFTLSNGSSFSLNWSSDGSSTCSPWANTAITENLPSGLTAVLGEATVTKAENSVTINETGVITVTFQYTGGSQRLDMWGGDLVDGNGNVIASDYHHGYTGNAKSSNVYTLVVDATGDYTLRYWIKQGDYLYNTNGTITVSYENTAVYERRIAVEKTTPLIEEIKSRLGAINIDASQLSTNGAVSGSAGSLDNLLDGNYVTEFVTTWTSSVSESHYIQVDLGEEPLGLEEFTLLWVNRSNGRDGLYAGNIKGSTDGSNWDVLKEIADGEVSKEASAKIQIDGLSLKNSSDVQYRYIRLTCTLGQYKLSANNEYCFGLAEFTVKGTLNAEEQALSDLCDAAQAVIDDENSTAADINEQFKALKLATVEKPTYPFTLTTDDANPTLYVIKSGRNGNPCFTLTNDGYISLTAFTGADTQAWYFKEEVNEDYEYVLNIIPYAAPTTTMGYTSTDDKPAMVSNAVSNTCNDWLLDQAYSKLGIKPYKRQSTYLSNNGGVGNKMGFWWQDPDTDPGTALYITLATEEVNTLLENLVTSAEGITAGTMIGSYTAKSVDATVPSAIASVNFVKESATATYAEKVNAIAEFNAAINSLEIILPEEGKFYTITNQATDRSGKTALTIEANGGLKGVDATAMDGVFQFVNAGNNAFYLYSVERGTYLSTAEGHGTQTQNFALATETSAAKSVALSRLADGVVGITPNGGAMLHVESWYGQVVGWNETAATKASAWVISEPEYELSHTLSVGEAGWSTIVLGYNATIPTAEGFKAYTIASQEDGYVKLEEATGVLGANVPVLVNATAGDYEFAYTTEAATVTASGLAGTLYNKNITAEAYVLSKVNDVVGLYKAQLTDGTFLNNANKAYYVPTSGSAAPMFSLERGEGTTSIENAQLTIDNVAIYDLTGRRVEKMEKGIYIVNGKKIIK